MQSKLQELLDREAIRDVVLRYCRAVDRCDEELLRSVYWPDAIDHHGVASGTVEELVASLMPILRSTDQNSHQIGNILIELAAPRAAVESYVLAYHRLRTDQGPQDLFVGARYVDRMEKRGEEWRIAERRVLYDWFRFLDGSADWTRGLLGDPLPMGKRHPEDPSYACFDRLEG